MADTKPKSVWITTVDNPFDPFTQWDRWFNYDEQRNYHTCARVANLAPTSNENLTEKENVELINSALVTLCEFYGPKVYRIVTEGETQPW